MPEACMKRIVGFWIVASCLLAMICSGCNKTRTVTISTDTMSKIDAGEFLTCSYAHEYLYCGSPALRQEDVARYRMMDSIVFRVRAQKMHFTYLQGSFSTRFSTKPMDYSLWICSKTGSAYPAFNCTLLKAPDDKLVREQLEIAQFEDSVLETLTEQKLKSVCGAPSATTTQLNIDNVSPILKSFFYPTTTPGALAKVTFDYISHKPEAKLFSIEKVDAKTSDKTLEVMWLHDSGDGSFEFPVGNNSSDVRRYLPCLK